MQVSIMSIKLAEVLGNPDAIEGRIAHKPSRGQTFYDKFGMKTIF